jgi:hypothetical protein
MQLIDSVCFEYRGRLSVIEAMNMPIGDLLLLKKFILDQREAADAAKKKAKQEQKDEMMRMRYLQAAYRGHPQAGISGTPQGPSKPVESQNMTREEAARLEDAFEDML